MEDYFIDLRDEEGRLLTYLTVKIGPEPERVKIFSNQLFYHPETKKLYSAMELWLLNKDRGKWSASPNLFWNSLVDYFNNSPYPFVPDHPVNLNDKIWRSWEIKQSVVSHKVKTPQGKELDISLFFVYPFNKEREINFNKKYYFFSSVGESYTLEELFLANQDIKIELTLNRNNEQIGFIQVPLALIKEELKKQVKAWAFVDVSKTNSDDTCPLSQEDYEDPYVLSLNGRTYSKESFLEAVKATLFKGNPLRLEDTTLLPEMLNGLKFYPHGSRGTKGATINFDTKQIKLEPYNNLLVNKENIKAVSLFLKNMPKQEIWDYKGLWSLYAEARGYNKNWPGIGVSIANLKIKDQTFPPPNSHPKCNDGHITFKNIHFKSCNINLTACWCGFDIKTSLFEDCIFLTKDNKSGHNPQITMCMQGNCEWIKQ